MKKIKYFMMQKSFLIFILSLSAMLNSEASDVFYTSNNDEYLTRKCVNENHIDSCILEYKESSYGLDSTDSVSVKMRELCNLNVNEACFEIRKKENEINSILDRKEFYRSECQKGILSACRLSDVKELQEKACFKQDYNSCISLFESREISDGEKNKYYEVLCSSNLTENCRNYGAMIIPDVMSGDDEDIYVHEKCGRLSSSLGHNLFKYCDSAKYYSCKILGENEFKKGNKKQALDYFNTACSKNEVEACNAAGDIQLSLSNDGPAKKLYIKACEHSNTEACKSMGQIEFKLKNYNESKKFYERACALHDVESCEMIQPKMQPDNLGKIGLFLKNSVYSVSKFFSELFE